MKFERNAPCPCGSGVKFKRCCGRDRESQDALEARLEAYVEAVALPALTPMLRPTSGSFDSWARRRTDGLEAEDVDAGVEAMGEQERERLLHECDRLCGDAWASLCSDAGDRQGAERLLLRGSVQAALQEREPVPKALLDELRRHREICGEPLCSLAIVLNGSDLWSVVESAEAAEACSDFRAIERHARHRWTDAHDRRLDRILDLLDETLPPDRDVREPVAVARAALARDRGLRLELAVMLLEDAIELVDALFPAA